MKIGKLTFKDYAAKKPVSLSATGEFLTAAQLYKEPKLTLGSRFALGREQQLKLVLERYRLEPDFKLGIVGVGVLTKAELIEHIKAQTELGKMAQAAELAYCNELAGMLNANRLAVWPKPAVTKIPDLPDWKPIKKCISLKVPTRALFCENTTDAVTATFAQYRIANVHPVFQARGFRVKSLTASDDVRVNFVPEAKNALTTYVSGIGHGSYTCYTGHMSDHILEVGVYDPSEVAAKSFHFLSCQTGRQLGPDTVSKGAKCYAGYDENFTFVWDDSSTPIDEVLLFKQCDSTFDITMANGGTAQLAYDSTVQAFNAAIAQVPNTAAATWLTWDRNHLKLHGAPATTILPYKYLKICFPLAGFAQENALLGAGMLED